MQADNVEVNGSHGFMVKGTQVAGPAAFHTSGSSSFDAARFPRPSSASAPQIPDGDTAISEPAMDAALQAR